MLFMSEAKLRNDHPSSCGNWEDQAGLVEAIRNGSASALQDVMDTYRESLLHFARQKLSGAGDPEDIVQEAFMRLWARRERLRPNGSVKALLYATVRSLCLDEYRRWKRRTRWDMGMMAQATTRSPLDDLLGSELSRLTEDAILNLPPRRRTIFEMIRHRGLTYRETANTLGVSPQTVANSMSSALADLRESLAPVLGKDLES